MREVYLSDRGGRERDSADASPPAGSAPPPSPTAPGSTWPRSAARRMHGEYDAYDAARARRRIAKEAIHSRWERLFELKLPRLLAHRRCLDNPLAARVDDAARRRIPRHVEAAQDLRALSRLVVHDQEASAYVARFVNDRRIEPDGALIFACLLDLAPQEEGAQFWWQFAAGAGSATSAYCLYLMHLRRGELRDAEHWAEQVPRHAITRTISLRTPCGAGTSARMRQRCFSPRWPGNAPEQLVRGGIPAGDIGSKAIFQLAADVSARRAPDGHSPRSGALFLRLEEAQLLGRV